MNVSKIFSVFFIVLFFNITFSQTGPGGVGNIASNGLWLKADDLSLIDSTPIAIWKDASGNDNNAVASIGRQPLFKSSSSLNGMPTVSFNKITPSPANTDQMIIADKDILDGTSGITFFSVLRRKNQNGLPQGILSKRKSSDNSDNSFYAYSWFFYTNNYLNLDINTTDNRFSTVSPPITTEFNNTTNYLLQMSFDGSIAAAALPAEQRSKMYSAGNLVKQGSENSTQIINSSYPLILGVLNNNKDSFLAADMSEVIHYNYALNEAERIIVNNYLSAKYNIPLDSNDFYTQDNSGIDFDFNVAGIGMAGNGSKHLNSRGSGIVQISTSGLTTTNSYLIWGEKFKNPTYNFSTNTVNYTEQLNSKWRVSQTGTIGAVTVAFDFGKIDLSGLQPCSTLQLLVADNPNFSSPTVYNFPTSSSTITGVNFADGDYFTLRYTDQIVWNGAQFFNGDCPDYAPHSTNSCLKFTVKAGTTATLTFDAHVREVVIEHGATLNVSNGLLLEVEKGIANDGTIDLKGEAQLIQNHTGTTLNTGDGSLKIRQQGTTNVYNYNYWSAPVNRSGNWQVGYLQDATGIPLVFKDGYNGSVSPTTVSNRWLHTFTGLVGNYNAWVRITKSANIAPGIGYTMKGTGAATDQEYIFKGTPNNGDYSTVTLPDGYEVLIGNPYPSALDADKFIDDNKLIIDGALYFWESFLTNPSHYLAEYEGGYATHTLTMSIPAAADASTLTSGQGVTSKLPPTQFIPVGQGFFVTIKDPGIIEFKNSQRIFKRESANEAVHYKTNTKSKNAVSEDSRPKIWFSFTQPKGYTKFLGLGYDIKTTYGYDRGYDAKLYDSFTNDIFWLLEDEPLVIQALPQINTDDQLPLGIKISDVGAYKFAINKMENVPDDLNIYLHDNIQNTYYNLRNGEAQLLLNKQTDRSQFSIVFKEEGALGTKPFDNKTLAVMYNPDTKYLEVHTKDPLNNIVAFHIYNTLGQLILTVKSPTATTINLTNIPNGVYILKIDSKTNQNLQSVKFVKY